MSHTYFCYYSKCANPTGTPTKKCSRCQNTRYCSEACHMADWSNHKEECLLAAQERLKKQLYEQIVHRHGLELMNYPYEHFQGFMKHHSFNHNRRTLQEWMEDWLGGWYNDERERKEMLRSMFHQNQLKWSEDAYVPVSYTHLTLPTNREV